MKLTPLDIRRQEFKRVVRGIDPEEVSVFLDMVAGEYERILRENKGLSEELEGLNRRVEEFDGMKEAIQGAVIMARKGADDALNQAKKEAELKLKEAEVTAERLLGDARRQAAFAKKEMNDIRNQRSILISRMKALLDGQMQLLEAYIGDWEEESREMRAASDAAEELSDADGVSAAGAVSWVDSSSASKGKWDPELVRPTEQAEAVDTKRHDDVAEPEGSVEEMLAAGPAAEEEISPQRQPARASSGSQSPQTAGSQQILREEQGGGLDDPIASSTRPDLVRLLRGRGPLKADPFAGTVEGSSGPAKELRPPRPTVKGPTGEQG